MELSRGAQTRALVYGRGSCAPPWGSARRDPRPAEESNTMCKKKVFGTCYRYTINQLYPNLDLDLDLDVDKDLGVELGLYMCLDVMCALC